ncbi:hypothetical protein H5410_017771 [Solanum commersonii]|uniref:Uncharacterized protein n=1 Tax=Solanum commersonii TaxID=4109 RepID=A0A9J6A0X9_SOLCO|nr:hypothetical protein H5410_017771 [Solanum commersonii]
MIKEAVQRERKKDWHLAVGVTGHQIDIAQVKTQANLSCSRCMICIQDGINFSMTNITARKLKQPLPREACHLNSHVGTHCIQCLAKSRASIRWNLITNW